jgi:cytidylate kinase
MYAIFLDGESKTGKTTVGSVIEAELAKDYTVLRAVAGSFFRRLTVAALENHGGSYSHEDVEWLEGNLAEVIESRAAYDEERDWSAIDTKQIDELVSVAAQLPITQTAAKEWWNITCDLAAEKDVDVLIVDGRNPRAKSADWRAKHDMPIALDLCVYCDPTVAAERYVRSQGLQSPSPEQVVEARNKIMQRRNLDRNRPVAAYVEPTDQIEFEPGLDDIEQIVAQSFKADVSELPRVIRFDTTHSPLELTQATAGNLARAALSYIEK